MAILSIALTSCSSDDSPAVIDPNRPDYINEPGFVNLYLNKIDNQYEHNFKYILDLENLSPENNPIIGVEIRLDEDQLDEVIFSGPPQKCILSSKTANRLLTYLIYKVKLIYKNGDVETLRIEYKNFNVVKTPLVCN